MTKIQWMIVWNSELSAIECNEEPDKPFSGKFVLRLTPEMHRDVHFAAASAGKSLNAWISDTVLRGAKG